MKKEFIQKALEQTEKSLIEYNHGNVDYLIACLHPKCMWIGSRKEEYYFGKQAVTTAIREFETELPFINLSDQECYCIGKDQHSCIVSGNYQGSLCLKNGEELYDTKRFTFIWYLEQGQLSIIHVHVSNPLPDISVPAPSGEERNHFGRYMYRYFNQMLREKFGRDNRIIINDVEGITRYINTGEILALEAVGANTIIRTIKTSIEARCLMGQLLDTLDDRAPGTFVRIHRSYVVNKYYIVKVSRTELQADEYIYPISRSRRKEIMEELK